MCIEHGLFFYVNIIEKVSQHPQKSSYSLINFYKSIRTNSVSYVSNQDKMIINHGFFKSFYLFFRRLFYSRNFDYFHDFIDLFLQEKPEKRLSLHEFVTNFSKLEFSEENQKLTQKEKELNEKFNKDRETHKELLFPEPKIKNL